MQNSPPPKKKSRFLTRSAKEQNLFLCRSCEETRFPYISVKGNGGRSTRNQNQPAQVTRKSSSVGEAQCTGCDTLCDRAESHCVLLTVASFVADGQGPVGRP